MIDLLINGQDAFATWGVRMGEGFLDAIDEFPPMKPYIENKSGLEHGKRVLAIDVKVDSRQVNLPFTIEGTTEQDYRNKKKSFTSELFKGSVKIKVPQLGDELYKLIYLGKGASYALSTDRTISRFVLKFEEPNPMDRK